MQKCEGEGTVCQYRGVKTKSMGQLVPVDMCRTALVGDVFGAYIVCTELCTRCRRVFTRIQLPLLNPSPNNTYFFVRDGGYNFRGAFCGVTSISVHH